MRFGAAIRGKPGLGLPSRRVYLYAAIAAVLAAVALGVFARLSGLGLRPLAVDEYYFSNSVEFILNTGLPQFPSGGYYTRGLLLQYLTALSILIFGDNGFALRLPMTLLSFICVGLGYLYCRRHVERALAVAVACALLVSSWHVEFARFARMYMVFQCFTLIFLIAFDEAYFRGRRSFRYAPHLAAVGLALSHSLSVLLAPLLLLPLVDPEMRSRLGSLAERARFALAGSTMLALTVVLALFDFRNLGVENRLPADYAALAEHARIAVPAYPFWQLGNSAQTTLFATVAILALAAALVFLGMRGRRDAAAGHPICLVLMVVSSALHQFAAAGLLLWGTLCRYDGWRIARWPAPVRFAVLVSALLFAGWMGYALIRRDWVAAVDGPEMGLVWSLRRTFFGWPDLYFDTFVLWLRDLPWIGLPALASVGYMSYRTLREPNATLLRRPWVMVAFVMFGFGVLRSEYNELRYWFFIYPVILCSIATALQDVAGRAFPAGPGGRPVGHGATVAAAAFVLLFALSGDFRPRHLVEIASEAVSFRTGAYSERTRHWYSRDDFATPARFVGRRLAASGAPAQTRVIVVNAVPTSHYLDADHAVYLDRQLGVFAGVARRLGTRELWSNRRLLSRPGDVERYTETAREVWLIRPTDPRRQPFTVAEVWGGRARGEAVQCISADGRLEVVRIELSGPDQAANPPESLARTAAQPKPQRCGSPLVPTAGAGAPGALKPRSRRPSAG